MKFATRLYAGFGFIIMIMTILLMINISISTRQNEEINVLVQDRYEKIKLLNHINEDIFYSYAEVEGDLKTAYSLSYEPIKQRLVNLDQNTNSLIEISKNEPEQEQVIQLKRKIEEFADRVEKINLKRSVGETENEWEDLLVADEMKETMISFASTIIKNQEDAMDEIILQTENKLQIAVNWGVASIIIGIIIGVLLSFWSIQRITVRLRKVKEVMNSMENGSEKHPRIPTTIQDEIGEIAKAYNEMASALEDHEKQERLYKENIEEQNWFKTQLTDLSALSQGSNDIKTLGEEFIQAIVPRVGANYGVIYLKEEIGELAFLSKLASYANNEAKVRIEIGEDLVGQCFQDGRQIKLMNIPNNHLKISSGLGETSPSCIFILPIQLNGEILGILELASITEFIGPFEGLLLQATDQLGIVINRIEKQMQVKQLLYETQELNDELQNQSEELQLQQEELRSMNEELESQFKQSEQRSEDLQKAKIALEEKTRQVLLNSQYKSEFLANMSHELRTPLNSLLILAEIFVVNREGNLSENQIQYANTIYAAGKDLLELISEILDLSKIESGKVDFQITGIDVRSMVSFLESQFNAIAEQKGISYKVQVEDDVPVILFSDEQKIYQVLKNLVSNALKFTETGKVTLKVKKPDTSLEQGDQELIAFVVTDTGIGITNGKQDLIFEAFQQADGTTSRKFGGTGLGLSISKGMADLLGGYITVESKEGEGSVFTFYLPLLPEAKKFEETQIVNEVATTVEEDLFSELQIIKYSENKTRLYGAKRGENEVILSNKSLLLVDDDMRNIFALTTALEEVGINVFFAENGREAINVLSKNSDIDLVLMDIMMPEMDGYDAMKKIRASDKFESIPIIALTAKAMKNDRQKCIDAGASDYISKPVNLEKLLSLLKVWLH